MPGLGPAPCLLDEVAFFHIAPLLNNIAFLNKAALFNEAATMWWDACFVSEHIQCFMGFRRDWTYETAINFPNSTSFTQHGIFL